MWGLVPPTTDAFLHPLSHTVHQLNQHARWYSLPLLLQLPPEFIKCGTASSVHFPGDDAPQILNGAQVRRGSTRQAATVNHPQCVNVYAGITKYGVTKLHVVAGSSKHKTK